MVLGREFSTGIVIINYAEKAVKVVAVGSIDHRVYFILIFLNFGRSSSFPDFFLHLIHVVPVVHFPSYLLSDPEQIFPAFVGFGGDICVNNLINLIRKLLP